MKVLFDLAHRQISIEGDGPELIALLQKARGVAPQLAEIRLITSPAKGGDFEETTPPEPVGDVAVGGVSPPKQGVPTLREFMRMVSPNDIAERIIAIGVYQARYHAQDSFSPKEMAGSFTHNGFQKPTQMPVAILSARQRYGYLESPSHGRWRVTTAGENAVTRKLEANAGQP